jgi:hypothetical protein
MQKLTFASQFLEMKIRSEASSILKPGRPARISNSSIGIEKSASAVEKFIIAIVWSAIGIEKLASAVERFTIGIVRSTIGIVWSTIGIVRSAIGIVCSSIAIVRSENGENSLNSINRSLYFNI